MIGEEVARQLITCLSTELGIPSDKIVASIRDIMYIKDSLPSNS